MSFEPGRIPVFVAPHKDNIWLPRNLTWDDWIGQTVDRKVDAKIEELEAKSPALGRLQRRHTGLTQKQIQAQLSQQVAQELPNVLARDSTVQATLSTYFAPVMTVTDLSRKLQESKAQLEQSIQTLNQTQTQMQKDEKAWQAQWQKTANEVPDLQNRITQAETLLNNLQKAQTAQATAAQVSTVLTTLSPEIQQGFKDFGTNIEAQIETIRNQLANVVTVEKLEQEVKDQQALLTQHQNQEVAARNQAIATQMQAETQARTLAVDAERTAREQALQRAKDEFKAAFEKQSQDDMVRTQDWQTKWKALEATLTQQGLQLSQLATSVASASTVSTPAVVGTVLTPLSPLQDEWKIWQDQIDAWKTAQAKAEADLEKRKTQLQTDLNQLETDQKQVEDSLGQLKKDKDALASAAATLKTDLQGYQDLRTQEERKLTTLKTEFNNLLKDLPQKKATLTSLTTSIQQVRQDLTTQLQLLKERVDGLPLTAPSPAPREQVPTITSGKSEAEHQQELELLRERHRLEQEANEKQHRRELESTTRKLEETQKQVELLEKTSIAEKALDKNVALNVELTNAKTALQNAENKFQEDKAALQREIQETERKNQEIKNAHDVELLRLNNAHEEQMLALQNSTAQERVDLEQKHKQALAKTQRRLEGDLAKIQQQLALKEQEFLNKQTELQTQQSLTRQKEAELQALINERALAGTAPVTPTELKQLNDALAKIVVDASKLLQSDMPASGLPLMQELTSRVEALNLRLTQAQTDQSRLLQQSSTNLTMEFAKLSQQVQTAIGPQLQALDTLMTNTENKINAAKLTLKNAKGALETEEKAWEALSQKRVADINQTTLQLRGLTEAWEKQFQQDQKSMQDKLTKLRNDQAAGEVEMTQIVMSYLANKKESLEAELATQTKQMLMNTEVLQKAIANLLTTNIQPVAQYLNQEFDRRFQLVLQPTLNDILRRLSALEAPPTVTQLPKVQEQKYTDDQLKSEIENILTPPENWRGKWEDLLNIARRKWETDPDSVNLTDDAFWNWWYNLLIVVGVKVTTSDDLNARVSETSGWFWKHKPKTWDLVYSQLLSQTSPKIAEKFLDAYESKGKEMDLGLNHNWYRALKQRSNGFGTLRGEDTKHDPLLEIWEKGNPRISDEVASAYMDDRLRGLKELLSEYHSTQDPKLLDRCDNIVRNLQRAANWFRGHQTSVVFKAAQKAIPDFVKLYKYDYTLYNDDRKRFEQIQSAFAGNDEL